MTQAQTPEALRLAAICETKGMFPVADELHRMHARILELEQGKCLHQIAEPAAALTEQDAALLNQGIELLLAISNDERNSGNCSAAEGATASAYAVQRLAAVMLNTQHAASQAVQPAVPLPLLVRDIARDLGITVLVACIALKPLGNYSTNSAVTAEMARMLRAHLRAGHAHPAEGVPALDVSQATIDFLKESMQDCDDSPSDVAIAHDLEKILRATNQPAAQGLDAWISVKDQLPEIHEWQKGSIAGISDLVLTCNEFDPNSLSTQYLRKGGCGDLTTLY